MKNKKIFIAGLLAAATMSACATTPMANVGDANRAAVDQANSKQVVSTAAVPGAPVLHPQMSAAAIQRYLDDRVKETEVSGGFGPGG
ncbi:MAG: hypothetical protein EX271_11860 [Acidimicrobiales bacterium]|nr:hypothetical protein [Hyphomonadaceae bacterium]RZV36966.1 MAG: hypothetical protein EX271_11860 [Acidimicrobiales bacterium]